MGKDKEENWRNFFDLQNVKNDDVFLIWNWYYTDSDFKNYFLFLDWVDEC